MSKKKIVYQPPLKLWHLLNGAQKLSVHTAKFCGPSRKDPPQMYPSSQKSVTIAITSGSCSFSFSSLTRLSSSFTGPNDTELGPTVLENALPKKDKRLSRLFGLWVFNGGRVFTDGTLVSTDFGVSEEVDGSCCIAVSEWRWCWGIVSALWWSVSVWSRFPLADELGLSLSCSNARLKRKVVGYYPVFIEWRQFGFASTQGNLSIHNGTGLAKWWKHLIAFHKCGLGLILT